MDKYLLNKVSIQIQACVMEWRGIRVSERQSYEGKNLWEIFRNPG